MAACDVSSDFSPRPSLEDELEKDDELDLRVNVSESELFEKDVNTLTVNDVYNVAASVGKEFEKLTDAFGGAVFSDIMPKIIRILEMLESYASRSQNYSTDVVELHAMVQKLRMDEKSNALKHREDLDMVDSAWKEETRQLLQTIESLQEDNKTLTQLLSEKVDDKADAVGEAEQRAAVAGIFGESVEKQRDELREKNRLIDQQAAECEALSAQTQQLTKLNVNLRRKVALMEKQAASMASQSTSLESTCREKDRQIKDLRNRLSELHAQMPTKPSDASEHHSLLEDMHDAPTDPLLGNKLIIDLNDPDRPRYTKDELQEVLTERNTFKLKWMLLQDELDHYKQFLKENMKEESWEEIDNSELLESPDQEVNNNRTSTQQEENHYKEESVIKKLFAPMFSRLAKSSSIPHKPQGQRSRLSSQLKYDPLMIDISDVMPVIDVTPSPEEEENPLSSTGVQHKPTENSGGTDTETKTGSDSALE